MYIENKIKEKLKNIVFLELKTDTTVGDFVIKKDTPLPINLNNLMSGIKDNEFENNIDIQKINRAIIYLLGIEPEFKYRNQYLEIIDKTVKNKYKYIYSLAVEEQKSKDNLSAYIYISTLNQFYNDDLNAKFTLNNILETLYNEYFDKLDEKEKSQILLRIIKEYEYIISENEEFAPAYYRLGYINRSLGKYIKSKLYFEKYLRYSDIEEMKEEVREVLKEIEDYANIETAITYISYGKFEEAYLSVQQISALYPKQDEVLYYKGLCQYNLGYVDESINSLKKAVKINKNQEEYVNQLAISYISSGKEEEAIKTYKDALFNIKDSYTIYYNLGILMMNLKMPGYKEYLKKAYHINQNEDLLKLIN